MRLILAAAALTALALPAQAQRLDTRRIEANHHGMSGCTFTSYREMMLFDREEKGPHAVWEQDADAKPGALLSLTWQRSNGNWRTPPIAELHFTVVARSPSTAKVRIDGGPGIPLRLWPDHFMVHLTPEGSPQALGEALIRARSVDLDEFDSNGKLIHSNHWDTHRLEDAVETVSVVGWSCTSP